MIKLLLPWAILFSNLRASILGSSQLEAIYSRLQHDLGIHRMSA